MTNLVRFLDRKNLLALLTIVVGVLSLFGIPQKWGLTNEQVIMGLLSFVAFEMLIVNAFYLEEISKSADRIDSKISPIGVDKLVGQRERLFELSEFVSNSEEVLMFGISLETLVTSQVHVLSRLIHQGCRVRFVVTDPTSSFLDAIDLNMPNHIGSQIQAANIKGGLTRIAQLYRSLPANQQNLVEVKTYAGMPFHAGIRILNRNNLHNKVWVSFYSFGGSAGERRGMLIDSESSPENYKYYNESVTQLWNASQPLDIANFTY